MVVVSVNKVLISFEGIREQNASGGGGGLELTETGSSVHSVRRRYNPACFMCGKNHHPVPNFLHSFVSCSD